MKRHRPSVPVFVALVCCFAIVACKSDKLVPAEEKGPVKEETLKRHIAVLASDEFEGRKPGTPGEMRTREYLQKEFAALGLEPGNKGSFFQEITMVEILSRPDAELQISGKGKTTSFKHKEEYVAVTRRVVPTVAVANAELVFAGFGIVAPEYNWNDFASFDPKGKILVVLVSDPGYGTKDSSFFGGNAMLYYGRWTYKFEEAARQGAAGILIVHETGPAGYPWDVVRGGWTGRELYIERTDNNLSRCAFEGWMTSKKARELFAHAGHNYEQMKLAASKPGFKAVPLGLTASLRIDTEIRKVQSANVAAMIHGAKRPDEVVVFMAHWDHFGKDDAMKGDNIFNGALDNASGTASLLALAEAFKAQSAIPERTLLFLATTAEEQGLLGSEYYAENPIFPLEKTVAAINIDGINIFGKMKDLGVIGYGLSELDEYVLASAMAQKRSVHGDDEPEQGGFYRSDHFNFAKKGVPILYPTMGYDHVERGYEWGKQQADEWVQKLYHSVDDEYDPNTWDFSGAMDDLNLIHEIGQRLANETAFPKWKEGAEFKRIRDAAMAGK